ncbi:MAG: heat-inducible transcription repressor HrcA [Clostridia bacterium]|nr:heat-inducible transcription repressor HrcA [Clostridia bacterium]
MGSIDDRKRKILQAIIDDYIDTAEPVGSRTIVKKCDLGLSPATIRNEMADLEDMGFLKQPHTSAGRVPSLIGYRYYVDELMTQYSLTLEEINTLRNTLEMKMDYLEKVIAKTTQVLSKLTNYTAVISAPTLTSGSLKQLRLIGIDLHWCLVVVITNQGVVRDKKIQFLSPVTEEKIALMEKMLNRAFANVPFNSITVDNLYAISEETGLEMELLFPIIDFMRACVKDSEDTEVYMDGTTNMLNFPEYSDLNRVKRFLNAVNDRKDVMRTVSAIQSANDDINIRIGSDNAEDGFSDCSIITSRYKIGDSMEGIIGIIGPVRMDYKKAVSVIKNTTAMLNQKMLEITDENPDKT